MKRDEATYRLIALQQLGEKNGLVVHGFLAGAENTFVHDFAAGVVEIRPSVTAEQSDADYRLFYKSRDSERERDVTDLSDADFVRFMESQPASLIERK